MSEDQTARGGRVKVAASAARVLTAAKGAPDVEPGGAVVVVGIGDSFADAEFLAFTIPEAERLLELVARALDASDPDLSVR